MGGPEVDTVAFVDMVAFVDTVDTVAFATVDMVEVSMVVGARVMVEEESLVVVTPLPAVTVEVCGWLVELEPLIVWCPVAMGPDEIMSPSTE